MAGGLTKSIAQCVYTFETNPNETLTCTILDVHMIVSKICVLNNGPIVSSFFESPSAKIFLDISSTFRLFMMKHILNLYLSL